MLWIALAAQLSMPLMLGGSAPDVRAIFSPDDMPAYVQIEGINRVVSTRTTVDPSGKPQDCGWERSSGDPKLDAYTCAIILKRAKLERPTWIDGKPTYAVFRIPVTWAIGAPPSEKEMREAHPPDMELTVNQLPKNVKGDALVLVTMAVDESGRVLACNESRIVDSRHQKSFPELAKIACQQMLSQYKAIPAKEASGKPVRSLQNAVVSFTRAP